MIVDKMHPSIVPQLEGIGYDVDYRPESSRTEIMEAVSKATGLIIRNKTHIDSEILDQGSNLKFIARAGAGMDLIDTEEVLARNIRLLNAPEGNRVALAEHALGMLLALLNRITVANQEVKNGIWDRSSNRGVNIEGKTIGIIGYGQMGSAFAQLLPSFNCTVLAYDKYKSGPFEFARAVTMQEIFLYTDILSLHIPLSEDTTSLVDAEFIQKFENNIYLVNTARGGIVNEADLVNELGKGKVLGAALDVLENEKIDTLDSKQSENFKALAQFDQVIITPHVGGWSHESYLKINQVLAQKIKSLTFS